MGVGESATVPSIGAILARWFPPAEYSRASGFAWSGGYAGSVLAFPLASLVLRYWGWRAIFYAFAGLGAVWLIYWWQRSSNLPEQCPSIDAKEVEYIVSSRPRLTERSEIPWKLILATPAAWAVFLLHFSSNWFTYFLISWLPTYLQQARHFSIQNMAVASSLPFLCALLGTNVSGFFIDRLSLTHDRTHVSKCFLLSLGGAGVILVLLCHVSSHLAVVLLFCLAALLMTGATPVYASGALNLVPGSAGSFVGVNTVPMCPEFWRPWSRDTWQQGTVGPRTADPDVVSDHLECVRDPLSVRPKTSVVTRPLAAHGQVISAAKPA